MKHIDCRREQQLTCSTNQAVVACLSGLDMGLVWAVGWPWVVGLNPFFGLPRGGHKLDMCPIFVQNLSKQGIL